MCFRAVSSNVNNGEMRQAVICGPHPLAFTTGRGNRDVREAVSSGQGQLPLLRLITLEPGCQRWRRGLGVAVSDRRRSRLRFMDGQPALVNYQWSQFLPLATISINSAVLTVIQPQIQTNFCGYGSFSLILQLPPSMRFYHKSQLSSSIIIGYLYKIISSLRKINHRRSGRDSFTRG